MKTRNLFQFSWVLILLCCSVPALAQQKRFTYDGGYAATYARNNAWMAYGPGYNQNPFFNFPITTSAAYTHQSVVRRQWLPESQTRSGNLRICSGGKDGVVPTLTATTGAAYTAVRDSPIHRPRERRDHRPRLLENDQSIARQYGRH